MQIEGLAGVPEFEWNSQKTQKNIKRERGSQRNKNGIGGKNIYGVWRCLKMISWRRELRCDTECVYKKKGKSKLR